MQKNLLEITMAWSRINGHYNEWFQNNSVNICRTHVSLAILAGATSQDEICKKFKMPKQTVNKIIKEFQAQNYLILTSEKKDGRRKRIILTEEGTKYAEEIIAMLVDLETKVFTHMGESSFQQLLNGLMAYEESLYLELKKIKSK